MVSGLACVLEERGREIANIRVINQDCERVWRDLLVRPGREVKIRCQIGKAGVQVTGNKFALGPCILGPAQAASPVDAALRCALRLQHVAEK